jgi:CBS-domain-containing membrane protein
MKNLLFFLIPKKDAFFVSKTDTIEDVCNRLLDRESTCVTVINHKGQFLGVLIANDLLKTFSQSSTFSQLEWGKRMVKDIKFDRKFEAVTINAPLERIVSLAQTQNFVPFIDDQGVFIGLITRADIINYLYHQLNHIEEKAN